MLEPEPEPEKNYFLVPESILEFSLSWRQYLAQLPTPISVSALRRPCSLPLNQPSFLPFENKSGAVGEGVISIMAGKMANTEQLAEAQRGALSFYFRAVSSSFEQLISISR